MSRRLFQFDQHQQGCLASVFEFGGQTVLEHVVKRALHYGLAPVCTTDLRDDEIDELCRQSKWPILGVQVQTS